MNKTRFFIQPEEGDNVDKLVKKWRKKIDSTKLLKRLKAIRYFEKPKEKRKHQNSLALHLQRMRTAEQQ